MGVLAFPLLGEVFSAMRGNGAYRNQHPIVVSTVAAPDDQHFIMHCTRTPRCYTLTTPLKPRVLGSAAYNIAKVADGTALAGIEATPKIWDLAAALLILEEAGGVYAPLDDQPKLFPLVGVAQDYGRRSMPLMAAVSVGVWDEVFEGVRRKG